MLLVNPSAHPALGTMCGDNYLCGDCDITPFLRAYSLLVAVRVNAPASDIARTSQRLWCGDIALRDQQRLCYVANTIVWRK